MRPLRSISRFGAIDADNDDILPQCFEDHQAYLDLVGMSRFIIVGRKGSGKTAIFRQLLLNQDPGLFTVGHVLEDYPWHYHDRQAKLGVPDYEKFVHSWKYLILLSVSKILLNADNSVPFDEISLASIDILEKFVTDSYGSRAPDLAQIFSPATRLRFKPSFEINFKAIKAGFSAESVPISELPVIIQEVNKRLSSLVMSALNGSNEYHVSFDELDRAFDPESTDYSSKVIGLLLACRDLNRLARESGKRLCVSAFLRSDIFDSLRFEDKNKLTDGCVSKIDWDTSRKRGSLQSLIEKRFTILLRDNVTSQVAWPSVFDEVELMPGQITKYQYILERTLLRPRDLIKFANAVLDEYNIRTDKRKSESDHSRKFQNIDILAAEDAYSDYFVNELEDELYKHTPKYRAYLSLFRTIGFSPFAKKDLLSAFAARANSFPEITDPIQILEELFRFSVVGFQNADTRSIDAGFVFKYKDPWAEFDQRARLFAIHPGFSRALRLARVNPRSGR